MPKKNEENEEKRNEGIFESLICVLYVPLNNISLYMCCIPHTISLYIMYICTYMQVARNFLRHMLLHIYAEKVELSKFLTTNHSQMIDLSSYLKKKHKNQIISVTQKTVSLERKEIFS